MAEEAVCGEAEDLAGECTDFFMDERKREKRGGGSRASASDVPLSREVVLRSYSALLFGWRPKK
ncbi:hypothetical protein AWY79_05655 [Pseudodesulfovibrio indicus]|uniref:Uncharacterized protein n=1 Tax=Pseudodesulfovibrio indicus TaxID=1716143 RepID=A0ABM5YTD8_9BACT|nr:hypothetical protein AWY79_05655 [Pseudodesulfovibrio indicus]